ncbi:DUF4453 domain-containing protein [Roseicyclus sp.]|uniref:DUF4453 domain-containing protein n=1 Tax=Roseicyclus sp. TaxID=1914329 RepID=UPI003F9F9E2E
MRIGTLALVLGLLLAPQARATGFCTEAWVVRNMIFDRLGHCFSSVAGQALFDNSDCVMSGPTPPPGLAEDVALIREHEALLGCRIDTSRPPTPEMRAAFARYARLRDLPVPDHLGFACWGYRGPAFRLLAGASVEAPELGIAQPGQSIVVGHWTPSKSPPWTYGTVLTGPGGAVIAEGWFAGVDMSDASCDRTAG